MSSNLFRRKAGAILSGLMLSAMALNAATPVAAAPFDGNRTRFTDDRFANIWNRTDAENVRSGRTWYWGPGGWFDYAEFYADSPNGLRTVQYFDKARMEINNPNDRSGSQQGVTNGLLVKELVSGRMQLGNDPYHIYPLGGADVPVAGNPRTANPDAPGYSSFAGVSTLDNGYRDPSRLGQKINTTLSRSGNLGVRDSLALPETEIVQYNTVTGHNIPKVFWEFMNLQGKINTGGSTVNGPVVDWVFAMGLPISDAYWTTARVGNENRDVLVQLFERRVLTYTPSNPAGYKVEMGNVGQHYFQWRYPHLGTPWASSEPNIPLVYASNVDTGKHWELYMYSPSGSYRMSRNNEETVAFSWRRTWDPSKLTLLTDSRRSNPKYRQIYEFDVNAIYSGDYMPNANVRRISYTDGTQAPSGYTPYIPSGAANDYNASYSPDGSKYVFISDRSGNPEIFFGFAGNINANGDGNQLTTNTCNDEVPTWSPDGRKIYWMNNCSGNYDIYSAELKYHNDMVVGGSVELVNIKQLTSSKGDDRMPRISPDGKTIAFSSNREGNDEIYLINSDGSGERRLTSNNANDDSATWSADGKTLAFASDRDGDYEIYTMDLSGNNVKQLTNNVSQDRWPLWAQ